MINYLQLISLTKQINLDWPGDIPSFLEAQMKLGDASSEILSFDCALFQYSSDIIYVKLVLVFFLPFMATAVLGLFFFLMYLIKLSNVFEYFINSLIITLFLLQPIMINTFFNAVPCTEIDINHFFLTSNLTTVCYNESYYYYVMKN